MNFSFHKFKFSRIFVALTVFALLACDAKQQMPKQSLSENSHKLTKAVQTTTPIVSHDVCLQKWETANLAAALDLQITATGENIVMVESPTSYPDTHGFLNKLKVFAESLTPDSECQKTLNFKISKDTQYFYEAKLSLHDVYQYNEHIISWPEMVRRMQFVTAASVTTMQNNVKAARLQGDLVLSLQWVQQWLQQDPSSVSAQLILANILADQKKYVESLVVYKKVLELEPQNEVALYNQAHAFAESGQLDQAIAAWQNLINHFSETHFKTITLDMLQLRLLKNLLQDQKLDAAAELLPKIKTPSFDKDILAVHLLRAQKDFAGAEQKNLSLLASEVFDRPLILYNMIVLEMDLKNKTKAQTYYDELKNLDANLAKDFFFLEHWQEEVKEEAADAAIHTPQ